MTLPPAPPRSPGSQANPWFSRIRAVDDVASSDTAGLVWPFLARQLKSSPRSAPHRQGCHS